MDQNAKYQTIQIPLSMSTKGFLSEYVIFDVCNLCGAVVGNKPAHDIFCYSDEGPIAENYK